MNKDYNLYKLFVLLYEERSISKVANLLYLSQPAVSHSLKVLEKQVNTKLFVRNNKGIIPTKASDNLYNYLKKAFNIIMEAEENINDDKNILIKVGCPSHISSFCLCPLIEEFIKENTNVKFEIFTKPTSNLMQMLSTRELDLVLDLLPMPARSETTKVIKLRKLSNCFAYSKKKHSDYVIKNESDLNNYPLILPSSDSPSMHDLSEYMLNKKVILKSSINSWTTESIVEFTRDGVGIGYFFKEFISNFADNKEFEIIEFDGRLPQLQLGVAYCEELLTPTISNFLNLICNRYK